MSDLRDLRDPSNLHDSTDGELCQLVNSLDAAQAHRITRDLRALKIPARMARQTHTHIADDSSEVLVDTGMFEVLVPEAFAQIADEVMDVTYLKCEGDASTADILRDLQDPTPVDVEAMPRPLLRQVDSAGTAMVKLLLCAIVAGVLVSIWQLLFDGV